MNGCYFFQKFFKQMHPQYPSSHGSKNANQNKHLLWYIFYSARLNEKEGQLWLHF